MSRLSVSQKVALLSLTAALCASGAIAKPARPTPSPAHAAIVQQLRSLWSSFWRILPGKLDEGCHLDPNGGCIPRPSTAPAATLDEGCHADPSGRCAS